MHGINCNYIKCKEILNSIICLIKKIFNILLTSITLRNVNTGHKLLVNLGNKLQIKFNVDNVYTNFITIYFTSKLICILVHFINNEANKRQSNPLSKILN